MATPLLKEFLINSILSRSTAILLPTTIPAIVFAGMPTRIDDKRSAFFDPFSAGRDSGLTIPSNNASVSGLYGSASISP